MPCLAAGRAAPVRLPTSHRRAVRASAQAPQPAQPHAAGRQRSQDGSGAAQPAQATRRRLLAAAGALPTCGCVACAAAGDQQLRPRSAVLDQSFASAMALGMADYEASIAPVKHQLFAELLGGLPAAGGEAGGPQQPAQLLELGVGTGPNLPYYSSYFGLSSAASSSGGSDAASSGGSSGSSAAPTSPPPLHITGVDRNAFMRPYLDDNLQRSGWPADRFSWVQGDIAALPLPDASCDAVVCTLVLCSVDDVVQVLSEVARVLRPGGALLFIEHTTAQGAQQPLLWLGQRALEPLQRLLADNCHLTRDPLPLILAEPAFGGDSSSSGGGVAAKRFSVEGASLIAPHVAGIARRQGSSNHRTSLPADLAA